MNLTISCSSVEEYFKLPKKERQVFGLYKVPLALPSELSLDSKQTKKGWSTFFKLIKQEYPIQYFFREWLFSYNNPVYRAISGPLREAKYSIRNFTHPCHPRWRKCLPRHKYSDITELVVTSNFALILDFYYEEVENGWVDWNSDKAHSLFFKELKQAVKWIEDTKPALQKRLEKQLTVSTKKKIYDANGKFDYNATYKKVNDLEKQITEEDTKYLKWFIDNRQAFWT